MDYIEAFGRLAFFSLLGVIASGFLAHCFEDIERKRGFLLTKQFWTDFKIVTWVLLVTFTIAVDLWLIIKLVEWIKS